MGWLTHLYLAVTGAGNEAGKTYGFWSGFGGATQNFLLIGFFAHLYRRHNCHQNRCWRVGRHPVAGGQYTVCRRHHPDPLMKSGASAEDIAAAHERHQAAPARVRKAAS